MKISNEQMYAKLKFLIPYIPSYLSAEIALNLICNLSMSSINSQLWLNLNESQISSILHLVIFLVLIDYYENKYEIVIVAFISDNIAFCLSKVGHKYFNKKLIKNCIKICSQACNH